VLSGHDHRYARSVIQNGLAVDFTSSDAYARGTVNLVTNSQISRNFNDYSATLGTTYLVGITSGVKFYGDTERTVPEIGYRYTGDVAVIPIVTVSETAIEVTSYIIEKSDDLALFPDAVTLLENFVIRP
jgi:L-ascorbate metabolism protein UlaG (beta-lactamase superfamily)